MPVPARGDTPPDRARLQASNRSNPFAAITCPSLSPPTSLARRPGSCRSGHASAPSRLLPLVLLCPQARLVLPCGFQTCGRRRRFSRCVGQQGRRQRRADALVARFVPARTGGARCGVGRTRIRASASGPRQWSRTSPMSRTNTAAIQAVDGLWPALARRERQSVVQLRHAGRKDHDRRLQAPPVWRHCRVQAHRYRGLQCRAVPGPGAGARPRDRAGRYRPQGTRSNPCWVNKRAGISSKGYASLPVWFIGSVRCGEPG
jgi:hypothetical protein